ncbi:hypothetical protein SEEMEL47_08456 [Salmonella enterica subsp. enterica serovar Meleagridis]|uniref:Domain of uncharacterized function (DUF2825) n=1 Tax=Salmonella enterica I TaxID=59201 RepID=A0A379VKS9_SALET|nr:hypothetical protein SEEMEL47_08456 [Salmonella enterica subsp. enterica serovar Meleagridis str. 0047]SUH07357.1 Domain of uncharacterised function (DUF2825) [Salmonella enterica subsp. enterica]
MGGLSPLARGTQTPPRSCWTTHRFIPAGAGNTRAKRAYEAQLTVYPRWRGEHTGAFNHYQSHNGLSPLARGTPQPGSPLLCKERFIPAGAGNTVRRNRPVICGAVYPRWRGEHAAPLRPDLVIFGLSPLARGTRCRTGGAANRGRFIPAGAGNTPFDIAK